MNSDTVLFSLIRYQPDLQRQEVVNIGIVVFDEAGPHVAVVPSQGKLLALNPNLSLARVFDQGKRLSDALQGLWERGSTVETMVGAFGGGATLFLTGTGILQRDGRPLEALVEELNQDLVTPPSKKLVREPKRSRLHSELRQVFRSARILGSRPEDITRHLVVPNFPIDPDTGLFAEFALRNGQLHVTETVDFRTAASSTKRQEAQAKTLILVEALERVGRDDLRRYVVVTGASAQVQASMNLLERYSDDLIVRESAEDWRRYVDIMHKAAKPDESGTQ